MVRKTGVFKDGEMKQKKPTDMIPCIKCKKERMRKDFTRKGEEFWVCNMCAGVVI